VTWLRYILDRVVARVEPFCSYDWMDLHECNKCRRIKARNRRIATYRQQRLPRARLLQ
jgi:hypothetical protein